MQRSFIENKFPRITFGVTEFNDYLFKLKVKSRTLTPKLKLGSCKYQLNNMFKITLTCLTDKRKQINNSI